MDDLLAPFRKEDRYESMKLVDSRWHRLSERCRAASLQRGRR